MSVCKSTSANFGYNIIIYMEDKPRVSLSYFPFPAPSALTFMNEDGRLCHRNRRHRLWENEMRVRSGAATELLSLLPSLRAH